jgi:competence protein ComEC
VAGFILFLGLLVTYPFPSFSRHLRLTFIDVGQGESILVEFPGKKKMLVDGGGQFQGTFDVGENVVSPVLWNKGIKRIDYLVLTHGHPDHLNGLVSVAQNFKIGEFWDSFSPRNDENYQKLKKNLRRRAYQRRIFRGFTYRVGDVAIKALHPQEGPVEVDAATNSQSLVLFIAYGQTRFLLTSDIGVEEEAMILEKGNDIRSQLLKSPHHGSLSSSSQIFLDRVAPEMIILSVGEGNSFGFPHREIIERYSASGARILRTDFHGAIEVSSDGRELSFRTAVKSPEQR